MKLSEYFEAVAAPEIQLYKKRTTNQTTNPAHPREYLADLTEWTGIRDDIKKLLDPYMGFEVRYITLALLSCVGPPQPSRGSIRYLN